MKRAKAPKPKPLPPPEQPGLFPGQRETLGLPIFTGGAARVMECAYVARPSKDPSVKQPQLF